MIARTENSAARTCNYAAMSTQNLEFSTSTFCASDTCGTNMDSPESFEPRRSIFAVTRRRHFDPNTCAIGPQKRTLTKPDG